MIEKRLRTGGVSYYWAPSTADRRNGCPIDAKALGKDYASAKDQATHLNAHLDAWRVGETSQNVDFGSVDWLFQQFQKSRTWEQYGSAHRGNQRLRIDRLSLMRVTRPRPGCERIGQLSVRSVTPAAADKIYERLHPGRPRQAEMEVAMLKKAWNVVARSHPSQFPHDNPWKGITLVKRRSSVKAFATRKEAYALAYALRDIDHPHLGAAAIICYEWHQRPENVLSGSIQWSHINRQSVSVEHWKTSQRVEIQLQDEDGNALFPEAMAYLEELAVLGPVVVVTPKSPHRPYNFRRAREVIVAARKAAKLPQHVTLDACRHGGLTELGDAGVTDSEGMALSGHKSPEVYRAYVKPTERQRLHGLKKRLKLRTHRVPESE
ncbi:MAG: tyrosine-type recombinase/integrase [Pseudomonadota bacterium]